MQYNNAGGSPIQQMDPQMIAMLMQRAQQGQLGQPQPGQPMLPRPRKRLGPQPGQPPMGMQPAVSNIQDLVAHLTANSGQAGGPGADELISHLMQLRGVSAQKPSKFGRLLAAMES